MTLSTELVGAFSVGLVAIITAVGKVLYDLKKLNTKVTENHNETLGELGKK